MQTIKQDDLSDVRPSSDPGRSPEGRSVVVPGLNEGHEVIHRGSLLLLRLILLIDPSDDLLQRLLMPHRVRNHPLCDLHREPDAIVSRGSYAERRAVEVGSPVPGDKGHSSGVGEVDEESVLRKVEVSASDVGKSTLLIVFEGSDL